MLRLVVVRVWVWVRLTQVLQCSLHCSVSFLQPSYTFILQFFHLSFILLSFSILVFFFRLPFLLFSLLWPVPRFTRSYRVLLGERGVGLLAHMSSSSLLHFFNIKITKTYHLSFLIGLRFLPFLSFQRSPNLCLNIHLECHNSTPMPPHPSSL